MFGNKIKEQNKSEKSKIEKILSKQDVLDKYILDDENVIIVVYNSAINEYTMIHKRLVDNYLERINSWQVKAYYFGSIHNITVIPDLNLFQVQNNCGSFNALYDFKEAKFVVSQNIWGNVEAGRNNEYLEKYNGFLAMFEVKSDYEEGDVYSYDNPITGERIVESFAVSDDIYYAIIDFDGTIRGNKLFKGSSFSKITEIIDLDNYESIDQFKNERKKICNEKKQKAKNEYFQMIESRNDGSISPYLDSEVAKVLKLGK